MQRRHLTLPRFVTTLRTLPGGQITTLYLIRSYDHDERKDPSAYVGPSRKNTALTSRSNTGLSRTDTGNPADASGRKQGKTPKDGRINYGKAQSFAVWEVARAATAAIHFFDPLKIGDSGSGDYWLFEDGGFSHSNNPTLEGLQEIEDMYEDNSVGVVVSVGTARKGETKRTGNPFSAARRAGKKFADTATDPEPNHRSMERAATKRRFPYYRLNDPRKLDVDLDEWEPKMTMLKKASLSSKVLGSTTLGKIEVAFKDWASDTENIRMIRACAENLVNSRRARTMDEDRWEHFATGARFTCRARGCDPGEFLSRSAIREHLATEHPDRPNSNGEEEDGCITKWR